MLYKYIWLYYRLLKHVKRIAHVAIEKEEIGRKRWRRVMEKEKKEQKGRIYVVL